MRRIYAITPEGIAALGDAKTKVSELFGDLFHPRE
jgi:DNA-binding PadR family transcriptional regulator